MSMTSTEWTETSWGYRHATRDAQIVIVDDGYELVLDGEVIDWQMDATDLIAFDINTI